MALTTAGALTVAHAAAAAPIAFNRDIRPILSDNCFLCHGPDTAQRKAGLRLDTEKGAFADLGGYKAIKRGRAEGSELYQRLVTHDSDELMPPLKTGKKLTPRQIDLLKRWIDAGAEYQPHWSYIAPGRVAPPPVPGSEHPIDRFIGTRAKQEQLALAPEADRATLIRRLSFDLLGLPPTSKEVDAFVADKDPRAYDKLVDRLLASPHFGERMAVYWLDLVRYGDSIGYHSDIPRSVWPYRDYVIKAFNDNMPFDRFTIEQLAGDLLPSPTLQTRVASTYNMLLLTTEEGGAQAKEYEAKNAADRVRNASAVWMGATVACAQCHDHKYDPYAMKDFYRMSAFFADLKEHAIATRPARDRLLVMNDAQARKLQSLDLALDRAVWKLDEPTGEAGKIAQEKWEAATQGRIARAAHGIAWNPQMLLEVRSDGGAFFEVPARQVRALAMVPAIDTYTITVAPEEKQLTGLRVDAFAHPQNPNGGLSNSNGNFIVTELEVDEVAREGAEPVRVTLSGAWADYAQKGHPAAHAIDGNPDTGWAVDGDKIPQDRRIVVSFARPLAGGKGSQLIIRIKQGTRDLPHHLIARLAVRTTTLARPLVEGILSDEALAALKQETNERSIPIERTRDGQAAIHRAFVLATDPGKKRQVDQATYARWAEYAKIPTTLHSIPMAEPRTVRVLPRGNWMDDSGEVVAPAMPDFLPKLDVGDRRATRLDLARWLVRADNPLTARVFVNRLWKMFYGTGLSRVLDDFGIQGEWPMHLELLDWLSTEFQASGWNVKRLVRSSVTSAAYRRSSVPTAEALARDPYNRLHVRQSPFRLDAEFVRDNALAVSGLLVTSIGGQIVKPYQPEGYWNELEFPARVWIADHGDASHRRGLYTHWQKTFLYPSFVAFDAASREECAADRPRSNTPQQALALLNDPTYAEAARVFAARIVREGGKSDDDRIAWAFRRATARKPTAEEKRILIDLRRKHVEQYRASPKQAAQLVAVGESAVAKGDPVELASWTSVARAILNLHETITRN